MRFGVKRALLWVRSFGLFTATCVFIASGCEQKSPLLGRWVYVSNSTSTNADSAGERGIEFLAHSKFVTFGYKAQGGTMDQYGTYSLTGSNRVRLEVQGIQTTADATNQDMRTSAGTQKQKFLRYSPEQQELTEEQSFAEPARFKRSGK